MEGNYKKLGDYNLNDMSNLNPGVPKPLSEEETRAKDIEDWNNKPEVLEKKVQAIDTTRQRPIKKGIYYWLIFFSIVGLLFFSAFCALGGYILVKDGSLRDVINYTCAPVINTAKCPEPAACPVCPACSPTLNCGNVSLSGFTETCKGYCIQKGCNSTLF